MHETIKAQEWKVLSSFLEYIDTFLLMIPATLLGSRIGQYLLDKISNKLFFYIFQIILIFLALRLLII